MAYTINRFDGSVLTVVEDGTIDRNTDIKLVGKNYAGYGEVQNENFVFLLENFASLTPPPRPLAGQIWFDSDQSKLKFYDGGQFRTTGGAEISDETPSGLTEGDFWWDTENEQLFAYNGTDFILVGPQDAGEGITQMQSRTVLDTDGISRSVIVSVLNDTVVHIISNQSFTIAQNPQNSIPGFDVVKRGITLINTLGATGGVTSTDHIFWGTASNASKLGGIDANQFVQTGSAAFDTLVSFDDVGFAVGDSNDLRVFVENDNEPVISNEVGNVIKLRTKNSQGLVRESVRIKSNTVLPGLQSDNVTIETVNLGSDTEPFDEIYANNINGLSEKTSALVVAGNERFGDTGPIANTVAVRDVSGDLRANLFRGTALSAKYADLAEKYTTPTPLSAGTIVSVCSHEDHDVCQSVNNDFVIGVISTQPAMVMNEDSEGQPIALEGRVPVRVIGPVTKGQSVYLLDNGIASATANGQIVGIALESNEQQEEKLIECVLKV